MDEVDSILARRSPQLSLAWTLWSTIRDNPLCHTEGDFFTPSVLRNQAHIGASMRTPEVDSNNVGHEPAAESDEGKESSSEPAAN